MWEQLLGQIKLREDMSYSSESCPVKSEVLPYCRLHKFKSFELFNKKDILFKLKFNFKLEENISNNIIRHQPIIRPKKQEPTELEDLAQF